MPYIEPNRRMKWDEAVQSIIALINSNEIEDDKLEGELNYFITKLLKKVYKPKYFEYNRAIGLLECIKQEFYRRDVAEYEDLKIKEHGDVK